jgi:hypothetical protein
MSCRQALIVLVMHAVPHGNIPSYCSCMHAALIWHYVARQECNNVQRLDAVQVLVHASSDLAFGLPCWARLVAATPGNLPTCLGHHGSSQAVEGMGAADCRLRLPRALRLPLAPPCPG